MTDPNVTEATDDDAVKWAEVFDVASEWSRKLPPHHGGQITRNVIAKAVELGLIPPRIDPADAEQVRVVVDELRNIPPFGSQEADAESILTALASHLAAREAGTE
jgi:hypothetical protein